MMDPVRAGTSSRRIRWSSAFVVIILAWSLGLQTKVHGADSARQRASRTQDEAWVEADPYLAYRYITVGWMDWAAVHFGELARSQGDVESWLMAGLTLQSIGDEEAALRAYELGAVLAAGDNRAESAALTLLGYLHSRRGHPDRAKKAFELALELMPENAQAMYGLGGLYAQENRRDEAIKWHRRAAESSRDWIEPVVAAAALLNEDGRFGEALVLLKGASHLGTRHAEYHYQLGLGYEGLLLAALERGLTDADLEALSTLGIARERAAAMLKDHALHAVDRVLQLSGDHKGADSLLSRLNSI